MAHLDSTADECLEWLDRAIEEIGDMSIERSKIVALVSAYIQLEQTASILGPEGRAGIAVHLAEIREMLHEVITLPERDNPAMNHIVDVAFERFHTKNPHVYRALVRLARQAKASGRDSGSIKMLFEVLRWEYYLNGQEDVRLNNNYHSRYARLIMEREPDLRDFFRTRTLKEGGS